MSPRAFDPAVVQVRLRHLAALLDDFADLGPYDPETLATDGHRRYTAETAVASGPPSALATSWATSI